MIDSENRHDLETIVDLVDDSKVPSAGAVLVFQVEPKGSADTSWVVSQPAVHELDAGGRDLFGQAIE